MLNNKQVDQNRIKQEVAEQERRKNVRHDSDDDISIHISQNGDGDDSC